MPSYDSHPDITSFSCVSVRDLRNAIVTLGAFKISTHSIYICQLFNNTEFPQNCHYMGYHYRYHPSSDQSIMVLCTGSTAGSENITIISNPRQSWQFFPLGFAAYSVHRVVSGMQVTPCRLLICDDYNQQRCPVTRWWQTKIFVFTVSHLIRSIKYLLYDKNTPVYVYLGSCLKIHRISTLWYQNS